MSDMNPEEKLEKRLAEQIQYSDQLEAINRNCNAKIDELVLENKRLTALVDKPVSKRVSKKHTIVSEATIYRVLYLDDDGEQHKMLVADAGDQGYENISYIERQVNDWFDHEGVSFRVVAIKELATEGMGILDLDSRLSG